MDSIIDLIRFACSGFWEFVGVYLLSWLFLYFFVFGLVRIIVPVTRALNIWFRGYPSQYVNMEFSNGEPQNNKAKEV